MEYWMTEKATIYALMDASESNKPFYEDEMESSFRLQTHKQALHLANEAYLAALDLKLFSDFDLKDNMLKLQNNLAQEYVPHDLPDERSVLPLKQVFDWHCGPKTLWRHNYLWCEAVSAEIFEEIKQGATMTPEQRQELTRRLFTHSKDDLKFFEPPDPKSLLSIYKL
jgi:Zn-dependent oligopeptidase